MEIPNANVHSFESFGTVDGPGVRFVIFFQGCNLRCRYCHNRDSWHIGSGTEYTVDQLFAEIKKYRPYFTASGGGVTASGGDPIIQAKALAALFQKCKRAGIHTTLDTAGAVLFNEDIKTLLSVTDLVLLDIKQINDERHRDLTGISNKHTLAMASYLAEKNIPTWIRSVIVPGLTDSEEDCRELSAFIQTLPNVEKLELLAYHTMGEFKWEQLNQDYSLHGTLPPTKTEMDRVRSYFSDLSIPISYPER